MSQDDTTGKNVKMAPERPASTHMYSVPVTISTRNCRSMIYYHTSPPRPQKFKLPIYRFSWSRLFSKGGCQKAFFHHPLVSLYAVVEGILVSRIRLSIRPSRTGSNRAWLGHVSKIREANCGPQSSMKHQIGYHASTDHVKSVPQKENSWQLWQLNCEHMEAGNDSLLSTI